MISVTYQGHIRQGLRCSVPLSSPCGIDGVSGRPRATIHGTKS